MNVRNSFDILHVTDLTDGRKLRAIRSIPSTPPAVAMEGGTGGEAETTVTDYCGDYIYEDGAIERINTPAGYLSFRDNYGDRLDSPRHIFFLRDHLGNNRVALDGANGAIMQINHYYPFGMPMNAGLNTGFQPWKFGGKEFDRTAGLDLYDFEARAYDPSTARFLRHDDLTEKYLPLSPYTYCANNPLLMVDPTGNDARICVEGNKITVTANIILTGANATDELAQAYSSDIQNTWGAVKSVSYQDETYEVNWDITVRVMSENEEKDFNGVNNYMEVVDGDQKSNVKNTNTGQLRTEGRYGLSLENDNPMSHEFGHVLGLRDKYTYNSQRETIPISERWNNDVMATPTYKSNRIISSGSLTNLFQPVLRVHSLHNKSIKSVHNISQSNREKR